MNTTGTGTLKMRTANNKPQSMPATTLWHGTTDFFRPSIAYIKEVQPGDHVIHDINCVIQGKPMAMPSEVHLKHSLRAFYVPQRVISKDWLKWINQIPFKWRERERGDLEILANWESDQWTTNEFFVCMFMMQDTYKLTEGWYSEANDNYDENTKYDIKLIVQDDANYSRIAIGTMLTNKGRKFLQILNGLGIEINWFVCVLTENARIQELCTSKDEWENGIADVLMTFADLNNESTSTPETHDYIVTKPLMAYIKIMLDFYWPSQYETEKEEAFKDVLDYQIWTNPKSLQKFMELFEIVAYEIDYFTGAWQNPTGPNGDTDRMIITDKSFKNPNDNPNYVGTAVNPNERTIPHILENGGYLTKYLLNALDAVQNYVTRNRIAGYRPVDRFLAQFGVHLDYKLTGRSNYIKGSSVELNITKVIAQAETAGAEAGQTGATDQQLLGGKGAVLNGRNGLHIDWKCEEHGYIIVIQTIIPRTGYYQGIKPHCTRLKVLDHYNGSFDNLGTEAIPRRYLFHNYQGSLYDAQHWDGDDLREMLPALRDQIWGYSGTYMSMKVEHDNLSGDYRVNSLKEGIESMHSLRIIDDKSLEIPDSVNLDFMLGDQAQYDRLFAYTGNDVDHIYYDILNMEHGTRPMKSASEALDITDGQGEYTSFDQGGSYMN